MAWIVGGGRGGTKTNPAAESSSPSVPPSIQFLTVVKKSIGEKCTDTDNDRRRRCSTMEPKKKKKTLHELIRTEEWDEVRTYLRSPQGQNYVSKPNKLPHLVAGASSSRGGRRGNDGVPNDEDDEEERVTPLYSAVLHCPPIDVVRSLLILNPSAAIASDVRGRLPLHLACSCLGTTTTASTITNGSSSPRGGDMVAMIDALLAVNPRVASMQDWDGRTPLHYAVESACAAGGGEVDSLPVVKGGGSSQQQSLAIIHTLLRLAPNTVYMTDGINKETPVDIVLRYESDQRQQGGGGPVAPPMLGAHCINNNGGVRVTTLVKRALHRRSSATALLTSRRERLSGKPTNRTVPVPVTRRLSVATTGSSGRRASTGSSARLKSQASTGRTTRSSITVAKGA